MKAVSCCTNTAPPLVTHCTNATPPLTHCSISAHGILISKVCSSCCCNGHALKLRLIGLTAHSIAFTCDWIFAAQNHESGMHLSPRIQKPALNTEETSGRNLTRGCESVSRRSSLKASCACSAHLQQAPGSNSSGKQVHQQPLVGLSLEPGMLKVTTSE